MSDEIIEYDNGVIDFISHCNKLSYEDFRNQWYAECPEDINLNEYPIAEYFCECDYKRYKGESL